MSEQSLKYLGRSGRVAIVTVIADEKKCVMLPTAKPGDRFDLQVEGDGKLVLTLLAGEESAVNPARIEERGEYSVGVLERPIDDAALAEALSEFP